MPKIITTIKADPIGSQKIPDTQIDISGKVPQHKTLSEAHIYYRGEALVLEKALYESLPGGLYDALLYGMLTRKASLYRYSYDALEKRDG
jgi:hypothetical protein